MRSVRRAGGQSILIFYLLALSILLQAFVLANRGEQSNLLLYLCHNLSSHLPNAAFVIIEPVGWKMETLVAMINEAQRVASVRRQREGYTGRNGMQKNGWWPGQ
uniref:Putative secreted protein n=1 Tax=Anopheles darlingi TaxID=43151 RepID=A0A2M4DAI3_ANODA